MFLRRTRRILTLLFELAEDRVLDLTLYGPSSSGFAADGPNCLVFRVGEGAHAYLSSSRRRGFGVAPERDHFGLPPQTECRLQGEVKLDGGRATLWLIEYDDKQRLCHRTVGLRSGRLEFTWRTHPSHRRLCLAVRLTGEGGLRLSRLSLMPKDNAGRRVGKVDTGDVGNLRVGSRGGFRSYSIFGDPSGYLRYTARHHKFYENRESSWYERIARRFADCTNVLDVGCGPGLLLEALKSAGVSNGIGLERDPEYLRMCRERGLDVTSHDLNEPFPFLESNRFDAVIAHHTFDYLAPIALRVTLREIARVLRPDGRLYLVACRLGRQAADVTRTARLSPGRLREALNEAGFEDIRMTESARSVVVEAMWSADETCWQGGPVTLSSGAPLYPFASPRTVLSPSPQSWDNLSCRDLTLLTDARKNEVRLGGRLVG